MTHEVKHTFLVFMSLNKEVPFETHMHNIVKKQHSQNWRFETIDTLAQGSSFAALDSFRHYFALHRPQGAIGLDAKPQPPFM